MSALEVICTRYSRGAIVKLTSKRAGALPISKFSIEKDGQGSYKVSRATKPAAGHHVIVWELCESGATYEQATGYAIRECERIRDQIDRGPDAPR